MMTNVELVSEAVAGISEMDRIYSNQEFRE